MSALLQAGEYEGIEFTPSPALRVPGIVWVTVWIDRDEDGFFNPEFDAEGVRPDGTIAQESALMQVVPVEPTSVTASDQEGDGESVVVDELVLPAPGFIEILSDIDGAPGERLGVSGARVEGTYEDVAVELDEGLIDETVLWIRVIIDFDEDGVPSDGDRIGLIQVGGDEAGVTITYTIATG